MFCFVLFCPPPPKAWDGVRSGIWTDVQLKFEKKREGSEEQRRQGSQSEQDGVEGLARSGWSELLDEKHGKGVHSNSSLSFLLDFNSSSSSHLCLNVTLPLTR